MDIYPYACPCIQVDALSTRLRILFTQTITPSLIKHYKKIKVIPMLLLHYYSGYQKNFQECLKMIGDKNLAKWHSSCDINTKKQTASSFQLQFASLLIKPEIL